jgi:hypothetical protein
MPFPPFQQAHAAVKNLALTERSLAYMQNAGMGTNLNDSFYIAANVFALSSTIWNGALGGATLAQT